MGQTFVFAGLQHTALLQGWSWSLESSPAGADLGVPLQGNINEKSKVGIWCSDCIARLETLNGCSHHVRRSNSVKLSHVVINIHPFPADGPGRHVHKSIPTSTIPPLSVPETTSGLCFVVSSIALVGDLAVLKVVL